MHNHGHSLCLLSVLFSSFLRMCLTNITDQSVEIQVTSNVQWTLNRNGNSLAEIFNVTKYPWAPLYFPASLAVYVSHVTRHQPMRLAPWAWPLPLCYCSDPGGKTVTQERSTWSRAGFPGVKNKLHSAKPRRPQGYLLPWPLWTSRDRGTVPSMWASASPTSRGDVLREVFCSEAPKAIFN